MENKNKGYVLMYRSVFNNKVLRKGPLYYFLFTYFISKASHGELKIGNIIIQRGQFTFSLSRCLSYVKAWGFNATERQVRTVLSNLEKSGMIKKEYLRKDRISIIEIVNYNRYQNIDTEHKKRVDTEHKSDIVNDIVSDIASDIVDDDTKADKQRELDSPNNLDRHSKCHSKSQQKRHLYNTLDNNELINKKLKNNYPTIHITYIEYKSIIDNLKYIRSLSPRARYDYKRNNKPSDLISWIVFQEILNLSRRVIPYFNRVSPEYKYNANSNNALWTLLEAYFVKNLTKLEQYIKIIDHASTLIVERYNPTKLSQKTKIPMSRHFTLQTILIKNGMDYLGRAEKSSNRHSPEAKNALLTEDDSGLDDLFKEIDDNAEGKEIGNLNELSEAEKRKKMIEQVESDEKILVANFGINK